MPAAPDNGRAVGEEAGSATPWWHSDLKVVVCVAIVFIIAGQIDDGTPNLLVLLGLAVIVGLLMRLAVSGWRRAAARRGRAA